VIVDIEDANDLRDDELVIVAAGSQGEPRSSLTRIAFGEHNKVDVHDGDWVVYSSRRIPGNVKQIAHVIDAFSERGARVLEPGTRPLHTSGHACAGEMRTLLSLVRPKHFVPVHGSFKQLTTHADLARAMGYDPIVVHDGDSIRIDDGGLAIEPDHVDAHPGYVVGPDTGFVDDETLRQRRQIGFCGFIVVQVVLSPNRELLHGPELIEYGVTSYRDAIAEAKARAERALEELGDLRDTDEVAEVMRLAVRRHIRRVMDRKPPVFPSVTVLGHGED